MKQPTVLYSSTEIHSAIKRLFGEPSARDRRVAIVAYVGGDGGSYLPNPDGLRIICSPSPGGTDPDTLRDLISRGATVEFSDSLHMKVYWSNSRGCLITSANASSNALGIAGLKEAGVLFPVGRVAIDRMIKYAKPRPVTAAELRKLDEQGRDRKRKLTQERKQKRAAVDFLEWHSSPHRSSWKIAWGDSEVAGTAKAAKLQTARMYGIDEPYTWENVAENRVRCNDWVLTFMFGRNGLRNVEWKYVDFIVKISPKETRYYSRKWPYHFVQVHRLSKYPLPPFEITPNFRKALSRALKWYGHDSIRDATKDVFPANLLNRIATEMASSGGRGT